jgi:DNA-binding MarR family transcriptional regulator
VAVDDQRIRLLKPSASGRDMLATFSNVRRRFLDERLGDWTIEDRKLLLDLLQRLSAKIGEVSMIWTAAAARKRTFPDRKG